MHARDLVEVAGLVALNGPQLVASDHTISSAHLEQYWSASKCRFESWSRTLKAHATGATRPSHDDSDAWIVLRATLDEIFTSELLTRVWTAILVARDRRLGSDAAEPVARNVLASHLEARGRALALLLHPQGFSTQQAVALNRLRRRVERWVVILLGGLWPLREVRQFAVEAERAADFACDLSHRRGDAGGRQAWQLTLVSLRNAFHGGLSPIVANPDANARIAAGILGCIPDELFDSTGLFRSLWMMRLTANASDAQAMISDLLGPSLGLYPAKSSARRRRI